MPEMQIMVQKPELVIIQSKIHEIRGQKVILDFDLAALYQVETRTLNQSVKRNAQRFPADFMFQLTKEEFDNLISQFVISSWGGTRKLPYAFTEQGIAMLSGLLNSNIAILTNISIMRAFVAIRQFITASKPLEEMNKLKQDVQELKQYVEDIFADFNDINEDTRMQLELINETLAELQTKRQVLEKNHKPTGFAAIIKERKKNIINK